jgi:hypothetical protein
MTIFNVSRLSSHRKQRVKPTIPTAHIESLSGRQHLNLQPVRWSSIRGFLASFAPALNKVSSWFKKHIEKTAPVSAATHRQLKNRVSELELNLHEQSLLCEKLSLKTAEQNKNFNVSVRDLDFSQQVDILPSAPPQSLVMDEEVDRVIPSAPPESLELNNYGEHISEIHLSDIKDRLAETAKPKIENGEAVYTCPISFDEVYDGDMAILVPSKLTSSWPQKLYLYSVSAAKSILENGYDDPLTRASVSTMVIVKIKGESASSFNEVRQALARATQVVTQTSETHIPILARSVEALQERDNEVRNRSIQTMRDRIENEILTAITEDPMLLRRIHARGALPRSFREDVRHTHNARDLTLEVRDRIEHTSRSLSRHSLDVHLQNRLEGLELSESYITEMYNAEMYKSLYFQTQLMQRQLEMLRGWMAIFQQFLDSMQHVLSQHSAILGTFKNQAELSLYRLNTQERALVNSQRDVEMHMVNIPMEFRVG